MSKQFLKQSYVLGRSLPQRRTFQTSIVGLSGQKSPYQVFVDTFRNEWKKSEELQDNIKQLQSATGKMSESEAFQRAKEAYDKAQKGSGQVAKGIHKTAEVVGDVAVKAWDSPVGQAARTTVKTTAHIVDKAIDPVRQTKAYKEVSETFDEGSSRYGLYESKEDRKKRREAELKKGTRPRAIKSNEEAGSALVATEIAPSESKFKVNIFGPKTVLGKLLLALREKWDEAENPLLVLIRTVMNKISGFFAETEGARVVKAFKEIDPNFTMDAFSKQLREYIVPEVLEAYINGDEKVLKMWLSEAPFNIISAQQKQIRDQGLFSDGRILDVRGVDIVSSKMLEPNQTPVLVIGCRVQEINMYRKAKTGELAAGSEEDIMLSTYAMVLTRHPENVDNEETEGWQILEFVRGSSRSFT